MSIVINVNVTKSTCDCYPKLPMLVFIPVLASQDASEYCRDFHTAEPIEGRKDFDKSGSVVSVGGWFG